MKCEVRMPNGQPHGVETKGRTRLVAVVDQKALEKEIADCHQHRAVRIGVDVTMGRRGPDNIFLQHYGTTDDLTCPPTYFAEGRA